jgi:hypothetical protein
MQRLGLLCLKGNIAAQVLANPGIKIDDVRQEMKKEKNSVSVA